MKKYPGIILTSISLFIILNSGSYAQNNFKLDYKMAEKTIDWLDFIKTGACDDEIKDYFMNNVAPTEGCKTIIQHWARFREWNNEIFYNFISEALGLKECNNALVNEQGKPTPFARRKNLWQAALKNPNVLREEIDLLKKIKLEKRSSAIAKEFLPEEACLQNDFFILLFGGSTAFSVGDRNGFDLLQLPETKSGSIDTTEVLETFAHELNHTGFSYLNNIYMTELKNEGNILLVGVLAAEGMPTYFINKPFLRIEEMKNHHDKMKQAMSKEWEVHAKEMKNYYARAESDIEKNMNGDTTQKDIFKFWLNGYQGPAYALGANMYSVIEKYLGITEALESAKDYRTFITRYNEAAKAGIAQGEDIYLFNDILAEKLLSAGK